MGDQPIYSWESLVALIFLPTPMTLALGASSFKGENVGNDQKKNFFSKNQFQGSLNVHSPLTEKRMGHPGDVMPFST